MRLQGKVAVVTGAGGADVDGLGVTGAPDDLVGALLPCAPTSRAS
jgi:hypothetical protein